MTRLWPAGWRPRWTLAVLIFLGTLGRVLPAQSSGEWPTYGGDAGGQRFSAATQITPSNVARLHPVWTFHTRALDLRRSGYTNSSFEATPILAGDTLYVTTPFDVVMALDAATGTLRWSYDPHVAISTGLDLVTSRGVAMWGESAGGSSSRCHSRVFVGTLDARLIALDAADGQPCVGFGQGGQVDLRRGVAGDGTYGMTAPPTVLGNVVVVGSAIGDNQRVRSPSGVVRGFDAVTGRMLWSWEPIPWARRQRVPTGAGNTWSVIAADPELGLVYLPTGAASPDYYGGMRPGDDRDANSVVALDAVTGKKVWAFQVVHHDLWDYDIASEPLLFTFRGSTPAIALTTKMGMIFILDRRTGAPLYPIHERPVPQTDVPGEVSSPTQPFSELPPLNPLSIHSASVGDWKRSAENERVCSRKFAGLRNEGIYTPPSLRGSVIFPGNLGGVNWGSAALDPSTGVLYANTNRIAFSARLVPRYGRERRRRLLRGIVFDWANWGILAGVVLLTGILIGRRGRRSWIPGPVPLGLTGVLMLVALPISRHVEPGEPEQLAHFGYELSEQWETPYLIERNLILDGDGLPCVPTPWGATTALDLNTGQRLWERPLGSRVPGKNTGIVNFGGPIVTAGGLVFTGAAEDPYFRAFDARTGELLWKTPLAAPAQSTPMTYVRAGRQYVVIAAGGHGDRATPLGDSLIAFALDGDSPVQKP